MHDQYITTTHGDEPCPNRNIVTRVLIYQDRLRRIWICLNISETTNVTITQQ